MTAPASVRDLFVAARSQPSGTRRAWLLKKCGGDASLLHEVEELLAFDGSSWAMFDEPAGGVSLPLTLETHRVVRWLGAGATGVVFEAHRRGTGERVALKFLRPGLVRTAVRRRFAREAAILAKLKHPAIARILGHGSLDFGFGMAPYLEMELVDGVPLDTYCVERELEPAQIVELLIRVGEGVAYAHDVGVIHRDLKPDNVLVDEVGRPRLLDFGVARADVSQRLDTRTGQLLGTLAYMSPEQARGDVSSVDGRSDLYALGAIAYELLTGQVPCDVDGLPLDRAVQCIGDVVPARLSSVSASVGESLSQVIAHSLAKQPDDRYPSVHAWIADLDRLQRGLAIEGKAPPVWAQRLSRRASRLRRSSVGVCLVAVMAGVVALRSALEARAQRHATTVVVREAQVTEGALLRADASLQETSDDAGAALALFDAAWSRLSPRDGEREFAVRDTIDLLAPALDDVETSPRVRARLLAKLAESYDRMGDSVEARRHWNAASDTVIHSFPEDDPTGITIRLAALSARSVTSVTERAGDARHQLEALHLLADRVSFSTAQQAELSRLEELLGKARFGAEAIARQRPIAVDADAPSLRAGRDGD